MAEIRLKVEDMSCGHCVAAITKAVEVLPAVTGIECSLEAKTVLVYGDAGLDQDAVQTAIQTAGYTPLPVQ